MAGWMDACMRALEFDFGRENLSEILSRFVNLGMYE